MERTILPTFEMLQANYKGKTLENGNKITFCVEIAQHFRSLLEEKGLNMDRMICVGDIIKLSASNKVTGDAVKIAVEIPTGKEISLTNKKSTKVKFDCNGIEDTSSVKKFSKKIEMILEKKK